MLLNEPQAMESTSAEEMAYSDLILAEASHRSQEATTAAEFQVQQVQQMQTRICGLTAVCLKGW